MTHKLRAVSLIVFTIFVLWIFFPSSKIYGATTLWYKSNGISTLTGEIRISPSNKNIIYATSGTGSNSYLYRSIDGGQNFSQVLTLSPNGNINSVAISYTDPNKIWVGTYDSKSVYRSSNGGQNWSSSFVDNKNVRHVAVDPTNDQIVYVGVGASKDGGVYKSTDGGVTWAKLGSSTIGTGNSVVIAIDKTNPGRVLADNDKISGSDLFLSIDAGNNWNRLYLGSIGVPALVIDNSNPQILFAASNGKVYKSSNGGQTWQEKSNGVGVSFIHRLTQDSYGVLYLTRRDNCGGLWKSSDSGENWENIGDPGWGCNGTFGLDVVGDKIIVNVDNVGTFYAKTNVIFPVVFVPGLGGSWSYKGLIENKATGYGDWKLMPVFTENYQALLGTFKNAGLVDGQTLFTFAYDWRQPVLSSAVWLNDYLTNVVKTKANIVGHSLGGLVTRACIEKVNGCKDKIEKFISVGSPHLGAIDAYYLWEGGEIPETNLLRRTTENVLLRVNAKSFAHPKDIIQNIAPSIRDILPVFDYISGKSYASMSESAKNKFLGSTGTSQTKDVGTALLGNTQNTTRWLTTTNPTAAETKLGLWKDGKPTGDTKEIGDGTVLASSAQISGATNFSFASDHVGLISDNLPQQKILDIFGLSGTIVTPANPATKGLLFFVQSPATLNVSGAGTQIDEKTVAISDPSNQNYQVTVTGTGTGGYNLQAGSFTTNSQSWQEISGSTSPGKTDNYSVNFTKVVDANGLINLNLARTKISGLTNFSSQRNLLLRIDRVTNYVNQKNYIMAKRELETLYQAVFGQMGKTANSVTRQALSETGEALINAYEIILGNGNINISPTLAQTEINRGQKLINGVTASSLLRAQNLLEANKKLADANSAYSGVLYPRALLLARSIQSLLQ